MLLESSELLPDCQLLAGSFFQALSDIYKHNFGNVFR
jgi:hypothetical protein